VAMAGAEDEKKMPLLEHLVELRKRLLYSAVGFILAFIACFYFAQDMFNFLAAPGALPVQMENKVGEYIGFVMTLVFAFGLCFELPVLLTLLARVGLVTSQGLKSKRRYAIVLVFLVAAVVTPPDVFSQISLAVPILLLYEISIILAKMVEKKRAQQEAELDEELDEEAQDSGNPVSSPQASE
jgi:sec-independent protein translocase protein TatC